MVTTTHPIPCIAFAVVYILRFIIKTRPEIDIFNDPTFAGFRRTLDCEMKHLCSLSLGVKKRQAELKRKTCFGKRDY